MTNVGLQLMHVLVGQDEPDGILSQLCHHVHERERRERLELVHIEEEGLAGMGGFIRPAERREANRRDDEPAEYACPVLTEPSLRQVHEQHAIRTQDLKPVQQAIRASCGYVGSVLDFKRSLATAIAPPMAVYVELEAAVFP